MRGDTPPRMGMLQRQDWENPPSADEAGSGERGRSRTVFFDLLNKATVSRFVMRILGST